MKLTLQEHWKCPVELKLKHRYYLLTVAQTQFGVAPEFAIGLVPISAVSPQVVLSKGFSSRAAALQAWNDGFDVVLEGRALWAVGALKELSSSLGVDRRLILSNCADNPS